MDERPAGTPGAREVSNGRRHRRRHCITSRSCRSSRTARTNIKARPRCPMLPEGHVEEHFANMEVQRRAARLGMWTFLATEILLFAGLFAAYAEYRALFHQAFVLGARHLDATMATVETAVLITGSFAVVMAHHYAKSSKAGMTSLSLLAAVAAGLARRAGRVFEQQLRWGGDGWALLASGGLDLDFPVPPVVFGLRIRGSRWSIQPRRPITVSCPQRAPR